MGTDEPDERPQAKWNAPLDGLTPSEIQAHIDQLYTSEVTSALRDMVHAYEIAMGVAVSRVSVRSMKTRWGSCTPKTGAIRIARELAAYPVECLDMVVAHELVHLLEPSHNHRFRQRALESVSARARSRHRSLPGEDRRAPKAYRA